jgi:hypothetical protein
MSEIDDDEHEADEEYVTLLTQYEANKDIRCDSIMKCFVEEASMCDGDWKNKFVAIDWRRVENSNRPDFISLASVLHDTVNFVLTDRDSKILVKGFQIQGKFNYKMFLRAFFTKMQALEDSSGSEMTLNRKEREPWEVAREKLTRCVTVDTFEAGAHEKARHRALQHLIDAIGRIQVSRFGNESVHFTGALDLEGFRR